MRTYLIDEESNEVIVDLNKTIIHNSDLVQFVFGTLEDNKLTNEQNIYVRKLAGAFFCSLDNKRWEKIPKEDLPPIMLNVNRVFKTYRGYKPSGLYAGGAGALVTNMPGKVVKVLVSVGDTVKKGQTLLILEAMKMENEIKAGMDGVIKEIFTNEGDTIQSGFMMMELE